MVYEDRVWNHLGKSLTYLSLCNVPVSAQDMEKVLLTLTNLQHLKLEGMSSLSQSGTFLQSKALRIKLGQVLGKVKRVDLFSIYLENRLLYERFVSCFPNLVKFDLFEATKFALNFVDKRKPQLKELFIEGQVCNSEVLANIFAKGDLDLRHLEITVHDKRTLDQVLDQVLKSQRNLVHFRLSSMGYPEMHLNASAKGSILPSTLKQLSLYRWIVKDNADIIDSGLRLDVLELYSVQDKHGLLCDKLASSASVKTIRCIKVVDCTVDLSLSNLLSKLENITHLSLCETKINDDVLQSIIKGCKFLVSLSLERNISITDYGFTGIKTYSNPKRTEVTGVPISSLEHLTGLSIGFAGITDACLHFFKFPDLRRLNLHSMTITDIGIEEVAKSNPHLEYVSIVRTEITDTGVKALAKNLPRLRYLDLFGSRHTTNCLHVLATHSKYLTSLRLGEIKWNINDSWEDLKLKLPFTRIIC